jgi:acetyl-CoA acyltransferase
MVDAVIVDAVRTASGKGKAGGALSEVHPVDLLAATLQALIHRVGIDAQLIDDVIAGCVGQVAEQALNLGRNAVLAAGFPESVPATTIDRQCGSSQQAAHFAAQGVIAGAYDIVIACGVESMSRVPMGTSLVGRAPAGLRKHARYPAGLVNQGVSAELIAHKWKLDREVLDAYAARSHQLASATAQAGHFDSEIVPIDVPDGLGGVRVHLRDETVRPTTTAEQLAMLRPSFRTDDLSARFPDVEWKITPGNSSPLTDGASAVLIMSGKRAATLGLTPRARFHAFSVVGDDPLLMLTAPISATQRMLQRVGMSIDDLDAYEVNEAFASVPLAWAQQLGADPQRLNRRGGAIALGHALGGSGTRLLTTLLGELEGSGGRFGLQTMCEGGGMANAMIIERL